MLKSFCYICYMKKLTILLLLLPVFASAQSNLIYGPWVSQIDQDGFTVLWVTEKPSLDCVILAPDDGSAPRTHPAAGVVHFPARDVHGRGLLSHHDNHGLDIGLLFFAQFYVLDEK